MLGQIGQRRGSVASEAMSNNVGKKNQLQTNNGSFLRISNNGSKANDYDSMRSGGVVTDEHMKLMIDNKIHKI